MNNVTQRKQKMGTAVLQFPMNVISSFAKQGKKKKIKEMNADCSIMLISVHTDTHKREDKLRSITL